MRYNAEQEQDRNQFRWARWLCYGTDLYGSRAPRWMNGWLECRAQQERECKTIRQLKNT